MASTCDDDWQYTKRTVLERNSYMFDNPLMSDISFTCGESESRRVFHAHKYVLATSSSVFFAMFYGNLAQKDSTICISDAEDESFEEFLRFLYTDDCKITATNAIQVLYLANKYLISPLAEKCRQFLEASTKPDNVFTVIKQVIQLDEKYLEAKCWEFVSKNASDVIKTEAFGNISSSTLNDLLKKETMNITEIELFKGVLKWIDNECVRQGINIEEDKSARRRILGDSVYNIRFLTMSQQEFAKHVIPSGIITDAEIISFFQKLNGLDVPGLQWKEQERRRPCAVSFSRFDRADVLDEESERDSESDSSGSDNSRACSLAVKTVQCSINCVVNKAVLFHGVRLFGDSKSSKYVVKFKVKDKNVKGTYTSVQDNEGVWGYDVILPKPISIMPDKEFTIKATIKGPKSVRGDKGKSSVKVDDIILTFKNSSGGSLCRTNQHNGQFYKIFLEC